MTIEHLNVYTCVHLSVSLHRGVSSWSDRSVQRRPPGRGAAPVVERRWWVAREVLSVRVDPATAERLEERAQALGWTRSRYVGRVLEAVVAMEREEQRA